MGNFLGSICRNHSNQTTIKVSSNCLGKPVTIVLNNDSEQDLELLSDLTNRVLERKQTITSKKKKDVYV